MKATKYDEVKILEDRKNGLSIRKLMKKYDIKTNMTVFAIIKRNGRDHIIGNKKYQVNEKYFEDIDTEEKAYWLGFLYADGYVRIHKGRSGELRLKLKRTDKHHIEKFNLCLSSNYPVKDGTSTVHNVKSFNSFLSIYNTKMVKDLMNIGCVNKKSFIVEMPNIYEDLIRHFIRGYFDGDGWFSVRSNFQSPNFGICSGSEKIIKQIFDILEENDIICRMIKDRVSRVMCSKKQYMLLLYNYLYKDSTIFLGRKFDKFNGYINNSL
jgi:hypothetical protein